jgi:hypothetical protein
MQRPTEEAVNTAVDKAVDEAVKEPNKAPIMVPIKPSSNEQYDFFIVLLRPIVNKLPRPIIVFLTKVFDYVERWISELDTRTVIALSLVLLGLFILQYPRGSTLTRLVEYGGSITGYGVTSILFGGLLLKFPHTKAYMLLITPMILYAIFFSEFLVFSQGVPTPLIFYGLTLFFLIKEAVKR